MSQTSEKIDLSAWFRKKDAAERIGCSEKHVEKLAREGSLERQMYRRPEGGPRVAVYHPRDVEKLSGQMNPNGGHVMPAINENFISGDRDAFERRQLLPIVLRTLPNGLTVAAPSAETSGILVLPPSELQFVGYLSITEAMKFTGLPEKTIQRFAKEGRLFKIGTKYRRKDLEAL